MPISLGSAGTGRTVYTTDLIAATRRYLYGRERQQANQLAGDLTDLTTTVQFTYDLGGIQPGATIGVGLEEMYVWTVDPGTKTAVVQRGMNGSQPGTHFTGDLVTVGPRYSDWEIFSELNNTLIDLSAPTSGLFQVRTVDLTAVSGQVGYDFPTTDFLSIADVAWQVPNTVTKSWVEITDWQLSYDLPVGAFPSGTALFINGDQPIPQQTIRVRYRALLSPLVSLTDPVITITGLPGTALDIPSLGAALRVMDGRAIGRADFTRQGDTRRADEVRVAEVTQAPAALRARYAQRVQAEAARLQQQWPLRGRERIQIGVRR